MKRIWKSFLFHCLVGKHGWIVAEHGKAPFDVDLHAPIILGVALQPAPPGRLGLACMTIAVTNSRMVANSVGLPRFSSSANCVTALVAIEGFRVKGDQVVGLISCLKPRGQSDAFSLVHSMALRR